MFRKGLSILPFAFIALVVSLGIISWSFYNVYYGSRYQMNVFEHSKLDTVRNEAEKAKKFVKQSSLYSSHKTLSKSASMGGIIHSDYISAASWICNTPRPAGYSKTKNCLEKYTKFYTNIYLDNYTMELPIELTRKPFQNIKYKITREGVFGGKFDGGDFKVFLGGGKLSLSSNDIQITDSLDQSEIISRNRFWYLWRNFYEWAQDNVYGKGICKCTSNCKGCPCAEKAAQRALKDLERRFDKYVSCQKTCDCCYGCQNTNFCSVGQASCGVKCKPSDCLYWDTEKCSYDCRKECENPKNLDFETQNIPTANVFNESRMENVLYSNSENYNYSYSKTTNFIQDSTQLEASSGDSATSGDEEEEPCPIYFENKLAATHTFSCTDRKYLVPSRSGPIPLTFKVKASARYKDRDGCGCKMVAPCPCPGNEGKKC